MNKVYNGLPMWRLFKNKIIQNNIFECYSHQFVYVELPYWFPICDKNVTSESSDWFWNEKKNWFRSTFSIWSNFSVISETDICIDMNMFTKIDVRDF